MDEYYEQLLYKDNKSKIIFVKIIQSLILVIAAVCLFERNIMGILICAVFFVGTKIYCDKRLVEFEYHLCESELRIYKIVNESKRSLINIIDLNNILDVRKVSEYLKSDEAIKCYVGNVDNYTLLKTTTIYKGDYVSYVLAVDNRMLENFKRINQAKFMFF